MGCVMCCAKPRPLPSDRPTLPLGPGGGGGMVCAPAISLNFGAP